MQVVLARVVNMYDDIYDVIVNTTPAQVPRTQGILVVEARVYIQKKRCGWAGCVCGGEGVGNRQNKLSGSECGCVQYSTINNHND